MEDEGEVVVAEGEVEVDGEGEGEAGGVVEARASLKVTQTLPGSVARSRYLWRDCREGPRSLS